MNKITSTGLTEPNEVDFGQIYFRNGEYYIIASSDGSSVNYLLVELSSGSIWSNSRTKETLIEELNKQDFKRFRGTIQITTD